MQTFMQGMAGVVANSFTSTYPKSFVQVVEQPVPPDLPVSLITLGLTHRHGVKQTRNNGTCSTTTCSYVTQRLWYRSMDF